MSCCGSTSNKTFGKCGPNVPVCTLSDGYVDRVYVRTSAGFLRNGVLVPSVNQEEPKVDRCFEPARRLTAIC